MDHPNAASSPISFICAQDGKLVLQTDATADRAFRCACASEVAAVLRVHGAMHPVLKSSSIDCCDTDGGFAEPGAALAMWEEGVRLAQLPPNDGEPPPVQPTSQSAAAMRAAALAMLDKASQLDGMKLYAIEHDHRHGTDTHYAWFAHPPSHEEMEQVINAVTSFDPDESLQAFPFDLQVLSAQKAPVTAPRATDRPSVFISAARERG